MGKDLVQAVPFMYALHCLTGKVDDTGIQLCLSNNTMFHNSCCLQDLQWSECRFNFVLP